MAVKKKKRRRRGFLYIPIIFLLAVFIAGFGISVFFRISAIEIEGQTRYGDDEIIAVSGIETGGNLILLKRGPIRENLEKTLPYIESAQIIKKWPSRVIIRIEESAPALYIANASGDYILSQNLKILERSAAPEGLIEIRGVAAGDAVVGQVLDGEETATRITYLTKIISRLSDLELLEKTGWIELLDSGGAAFYLDDRFRVELGGAENTERKFDILTEVLNSLEPMDYGTIDLTVENEAYFKPG